MRSIIMCKVNNDSDGIAFNTDNITRIIRSSDAKIVFSEKDGKFFLEVDDGLLPVKDGADRENIKPYFLLHKSGEVFNVTDYQLLFRVKKDGDQKLSGVDVGGKEHHCLLQDHNTVLMDLSIEEIEQRLRTADDSIGKLKDLRDMVRKLKRGEFYEALTSEFSGKIKEIAQELIEFRRDLQNKIEPDIVMIASRDIPEASNQLEGINKTLESSTMKIMDINEEQMELANKRLEDLKPLVSGNGRSPKTVGDFLAVLGEEMAILKKIGTLSLSMMEPLSFQDLVGQRIQRIIRLVKSMEGKMKDLIISFGIKIQKHRENPDRSFEELRQDVENYKIELKGPQGEGEGLNQADIDDLLATL